MNSQPPHGLPLDHLLNSSSGSTSSLIRSPPTSTNSTQHNSIISTPSRHSRLSLLSLPDEILCRIITCLLTDSQRGTPFYPPCQPPFALLPVAQVSTTLRRLVSRVLISDDFWYTHIVDADIFDAPFAPEGLGWTADHGKRYMEAWYRLAGSNLKSLTCSFRADWYIPLMEHIMPFVAGFRPKLTVLDLSSFGTRNCNAVIEATGELLREGRHSLRELRLRIGTDLTKAVNKAALKAVRVLHLKLTGACEKGEILSLMASLNDEKGTCTVNELQIKVSGPCPRIEKEEWQNVAGESIKVFKVTAYVGMRESEEALWNWVGHMRELKHLLLSGVVMSTKDVRTLLKRDIKRVELVKCEINGLVKGVEGLEVEMPKKVRRLELLETCKGEILKEVGRVFEKVEWLAIKVMRDGTGEVGGMLCQMLDLRVLEIAVCGEGKIEKGGWELMEGLMQARKGLRRLILKGIALPVLGVDRFFGMVSSEIQYAVMGLYIQNTSMSEAMIWLLEGVLRECRGLRILCFGMNIIYDKKAEELHGKLLQAIKELGMTCTNLDTVWLRKNADSLVAKLKHTRRRGQRSQWFD